MTSPPIADDLAALRLFDAVIHLGSLSKAARANGITQPSASARIATLERRLGVRLLHRTTTGSQPTATGLVVAAWTEKLLQAADEWESSVQALHVDRPGRLGIASSYTIAEYVLPTWLDRFRRSGSTAAVVLEVMNSAAVIERLTHGDVSIGFVETTREVRGFHTRVVATDELVTVVAANHPWAKRKSIDLPTFATSPLVVRELGSGTREALDQALRERGITSLQVALALGSTSAIKTAVSDGTLPAVLSELAVRSELDSGALVRVTIRGLKISRELRAIWPRRRSLPREARQFLAQLPGA